VFGAHKTFQRHVQPCTMMYECSPRRPRNACLAKSNRKKRIQNEERPKNSRNALMMPLNTIMSGRDATATSCSG
jgi:hypothetical protein